jgi:hypothetical protein
MLSMQLIGDARVPLSFSEQDSPCCADTPFFFDICQFISLAPWPWASFAGHPLGLYTDRADGGRQGELGNPKIRVKNKPAALKRAAGFGGRVILTTTRPRLYEILFYKSAETFYLALDKLRY